MAEERRHVNKRGGSVDGTFSEDGSLPVLVVRDGKILFASSRPIGSSAGGTVTQIDTGAGLTGGPITTNGTISMEPSGVTAGTYGNVSAIPIVTVDNLGRVTNLSTAAITPSSSVVTVNTESVSSSTWSGQLELAVCQTLKSVTITICDGTNLAALANTTVFTSAAGYCPAPLAASGGAANMSFVLPSPSTEAGNNLRLTVNSDGSISLRRLNGTTFNIGGGTNMVFTNYPISFSYIAQ